MKLYFGNSTTTITTILLLGLIAFWIWAIITEKSIDHWGLKSLFLFIYGILICCYVAMRDGFDKTVQCAIDGSCAPGIFSLTSLPVIVGAIGAIIIVIAIIATPTAKSQAVRELFFWIMSGGMAVKVLTLELTRILS